MSTNLHRLIALALFILVVGAAYYAFDRYWLGHYQRYSEESERLMDRLVRFERLAATREQLTATLSNVQGNSSYDAYYLNQGSPNLAATDLQQQVRSAIESNGGSLTSTQILPVTVEQGKFSRIAIRVQMTGDMSALQKMLHTLESSQPLYFVENVQIRARTIRQRVRNSNQVQNRRNRRNRRQNPPQIKTTVQLTTQFELVGYMRS